VKCTLERVEVTLVHVGISPAYLIPRH